MCVYEAVIPFVCVCVCEWERENLVCKDERASNPQGACDWEGNGELGLWEYEKDMLEDGRAENVEEEESKGQINAAVQKK